MHELSEAFHAISLRHTCLMSILEQFSKLSSRAGCLTGNRLNGNIPDGIKGRQSRTNLFRSFSEEGNLELGGCLENCPCQKSEYIKCEEVQQNFILTDDWGFSSTGHFWDHNRTINDYIAQNVSVLGMNHSGLYTKARLSPLSFTYYGRCLADGNYTVKIHFAEIIIRGNKSFHSLGRQIFNVYIQVLIIGKIRLVLGLL
ncbi:hypothetical protein VitviT2T_030360 [Vitis vinifera]|uniref:Malectin domain-containing protein n=1 Tax=Vitis vinifera TaxID=29760 RepID=A0ABY9DZ85_VITVI|nr:hypothetical protein VitviT2T_030360 [Vitis vinifera]